MSKLKSTKQAVILEDTQCNCFGLSKIEQQWFLSEQKKENNKNRCENIDNLHDNFAVGDNKRSKKLSLKGYGSEKCIPLMLSHKHIPSIDISKKGKNPIPATKNKKYQLIDLQKCKVYPVYKNSRHQYLNQKSTAQLTNTFIPTKEELQRFPLNIQKNQPVFQQLQNPNITNQYFLSPQRQQVKSPRFLSPKYFEKIENSNINLINNEQQNKRANKISQKIYSLKKIEEKNSIQFSLYPKNQFKPVSKVMHRQEKTLVNQDNFNQSIDTNAAKQKTKSEFSIGKRYTSNSKIQKAREAIQSIIARRKNQFSKEKVKIIKQPFSDCVKLGRNKLLRIDDLEEICSLADEDERTNSQKESIVIGRLNDYGSYADLKTQDALTSYSKLFSPNTHNSPIETSNKRSLFFHYHEQFVSE